MMKEAMYDYFVEYQKHKHGIPRESGYVDAEIVHTTQVLTEFFWPNRLLWSNGNQPYVIPGYYASS